MKRGGILRSRLLMLCLTVESTEVEGAEVVLDGFGAADELDIAAGGEEEFGGAEFAIVVEAHSVSVRSRIVDDDDISTINLGQGTVDGEFVEVFAERAYDIICVSGAYFLFTQNGDVMVRAV